MIHLPLLRAGRPYTSLDQLTLRDLRTQQPIAKVSQAHPGLVARDLAVINRARAALAAVPTAERLAMGRRAAQLFAEASLPAGGAGGDGDALQGPEDYLSQLSSTTGMPLALGRRNIKRLRTVLESLPETLRGLSRGLSPEFLDRGFGIEAGVRLAYTPTTEALGAILPNNSPGVHGLWQPALALGTPVVLKTGRMEPWTPYRLAQAWIAAGCPPEAWSLYPGEVPVATEILLRCGRSLLFGDANTTARWAGDPRVQLHGPGWSKVLFGPDTAATWRDHLDLLVESIAGNGGRSCLNASGVWLPAEAGEGRALAAALAERLATVVARPLDDPEAGLAAFANPGMARAIDNEITRALEAGGAVDLTTPLRGTPRLIEVDGCTFLQPTVVWCESADHPLAQAEFLFPFAAVVEAPLAELPRAIGATLIATALTSDAALSAALLANPRIDKLNFGSVPTLAVDWQQPHEGNLFDVLYRRRALSAPEPLWHGAAWSAAG